MDTEEEYRFGGCGSKEALIQKLNNFKKANESQTMVKKKIPKPLLTDCDTMFF